MGGEREVLPTGQAVVETHRVWQITDPSFDRERVTGGIETQHLDTAGGRLDQAQKHQNGRGFAGPVRAQQTENLTCFELEVEMVHDPCLTVVLRQLVSDDGGGRARLRVGQSYLRPKRLKTQANAARVKTINPIPTRPPKAEGLTVLRTSIEASASSVVARNVIE